VKPHCGGGQVEVTCDVITREWSVFQLKNGHKFSNDDLFTAWRAAVNCPRAVKLLDIGSGIGSVGLSTLWKMQDPRATLTTIEAQVLARFLPWLSPHAVVCLLARTSALLCRTPPSTTMVSPLA
jgi:hypothetical protein